MERIAIILALFLVVCSNAMASNCGKAEPRNTPAFCASFKSIAVCHCTQSGLPGAFCTDMKKVYTRMITVYGTQQKACNNQRDTTAQDCMNDWNCYRLGGKDSNGWVCNGTGAPCP